MNKYARELALSVRICAIAITATLAGCLDSGDPATAYRAASAPSAADTLTILGVPPTEVVSNSKYYFQPSVDNGSGATTADVSYRIQNKPNWASFDSGTGALSGVPDDTQVGVTGEITITAQAKATYKTGSVGPFRISVKAHGSGSTSNAAPSISGTPATTATVNLAYSFSPAASDPEGATLAFSIVNRPTWAAFDTTTGKLSGTPQSANVGSYNNIVIRVSDGNSSTSLPAFNIAVVTAGSSGSTTTANVSPSIGGTPVTTATTGAAYSFTPSASDANGDTLTFSIQNKPSWASFNNATGQLYGTPSAAGTNSNIIISVSDGKATAALAAFSITISSAVVASATGSALLSWTAPTTNADGTALTDLAGYHLYAGKDPSNLVLRADVVGGGNLQYQATGLDTGTWYFSISAYNSAGIESALPAAVSTTI